MEALIQASDVPAFLVLAVGGFATVLFVTGARRIRRGRDTRRVVRFPGNGGR